MCTSIIGGESGFAHTLASPTGTDSTSCPGKYIHVCIHAKLADTLIAMCNLRQN